MNWSFLRYYTIYFSLFLLAFGEVTEPLESDIDIDYILGTDGIAGNLAVVDGGQLHLLDHFLLIKSPWQIVFICENENRNPSQRRPTY